MSPADIALTIFALCNSIRVFAYVPQIVTVARDPNGATAISYTTWSLFAASHLSTVAYAVLSLEDWRMAAVFGANTACCGVILGLTAIKRARFAATAGSSRSCRQEALTAAPDHRCRKPFVSGFEQLSRHVVASPRVR
jgi:hypothetical protein